MKRSPYPGRAKNVVDRNPFAGANAGAEIRNGGTMRAEDSPSKFNPKSTVRKYKTRSTRDYNKGARGG